MRTRRMIWAGSGLAAAGLAAAVGLTARGQDSPPPPSGDVKYYQGKVSPAPQWMYPATYVKPGTQPPAPPPARPAGQYPVPAPGYTTPIPTTGQPRFSQPVMAGPDGVRQVSATEPVSAVPPPAAGPGSPVVPPRPGQVPPGVRVEHGGLPEPKPLNMSGRGDPTAEPPVTGHPALPGASPVTLPPPSIPPASPPAKPGPTMTPTASFQEQATPAHAAAAAVPSRTAPALTIDAVAPESVGIGQPLTYELLVRNVGACTLTGVKVEDELPARCTLVGSEPAPEATGERLCWSLGTMEAGVERRIKVTVKPGEEGELRSRATVTFASAVEARVKVTRPRVTIAMSGPETVRVGEKVPFVIKLSNTGTGTASKVTLRAQFSDGLGHPQGQVIEAELPAMPAGQTKTLSLEALGLKAGAQNCVLTAAADGNPGEQAKAAVTLVEPMLGMKQSGPGHCLVKGEPLYQIELTNPGTAATDPVQVWANLPAGFELVQASDNGNFAAAERAVGWRLPGLAPGSSKVLTMRVRATGPTEGVIRTVATCGPQTDPVTQAGGVPAETRQPKGLEAKAETAVKAEGVPALRFEVADIEDPVEVGREAVYEIRVLNQGTGPCTNVQVVAELAEGTTAAGAAGPTTGRATGQQIVFDPIPQFGVKAEAVYKVRVKGNVPGDLRFRVRLVCDQVKTPVVKEENTRFYKE